MSMLNAESVITLPLEARRLKLRGRVQGIGFRPFVYRLAIELDLTGEVRNSPIGAEIAIQGSRPHVDEFLRRLVAELPAGGHLDELTTEFTTISRRCGFDIGPSFEKGARRARVPADAVICAECRRDICDSSNRRFGYPFTACTTCGPRYSVIESLPYDRNSTCLRHFPLCETCQTEYRKPTDRRFHAQTTVCAECGPRLSLFPTAAATPSNDPIESARECLRAGRILALKGLGGYQLLVRADDEDAVAELRRRKNRTSKPLAVMVSDIAKARTLAKINHVESDSLLSAANPIVILDRKPDANLAPSIAPNVGTVGLFLPSTPLHELLLDNLHFPIVATSGNRNDEPPATTESEAHECLGGLADLFLDHDRPIVRRIDDSVVRVIAGQPVVFRMGRGFAALPLPALEHGNVIPILATGGHLKSAIAVHTGHQSLLSQHLGDLDDHLSRAGFESAVADLCQLFDFEPSAIVTDLHPDYFTTLWAQQRDVPLIEVQHHHAHAAAVQQEHGVLDREVLAVTWDGTGFGPDGTLWGGEFLLVDPAGAFQRVASMRPLALIGGEAAIHRPARVAFAMLWSVFRDDVLNQSRWLSRLNITAEESRVWLQMLNQKVNIAWSSGIGRLFDGLAALVLGLGAVSYEAEAAIHLESIAPLHDEKPYSLPGSIMDDCVGDRHIPRGDWRQLVVDVLHDLEHEIPASDIAGRIHHTLATWATTVVRAFPGRPVVLGGGCFQNRLLTELVLRMNKSPTFMSTMIPPGDGGLAAGQLAVALQRLKRF